MDATTPAQRCAQRWSQMRVAGDERAQRRWERTLGRATRIVEPLWPQGYSGGPFSDAMPVLAISCYLLLPDADPDQVSVSELLAVLKGPPPGARLGERLSAALAARGAGDALDELVASLRTKPEFFEPVIEVPSMWAPDFRERLAGIVEWTIAALERSIAAETAA